MKKYFGNIQTLLIVVLVVIILLMRNCSKNITEVVDPIVITKVEIKYDTITRDVPAYIPKYITRIVTKTDTVTRKIDTASILEDYFATYVYEDKQALDSLTLTISDSISQNKIISRSLNYKLIYPTTTITNEIYLNNREFYWGVGLQGNMGQLNYLGTEFIYRTKKKQIYGVGVGVNQDFVPVISGRMYWKLGK